MRYFVLLLFGIIPFTLKSQVVTSFTPLLSGVAEASGFGVGDAVGTISSFSDQTGFNFTLDSLKINAILLDQSGTFWEVLVITSQSALTADITITKIQGSSSFPSGTVYVGNTAEQLYVSIPSTSNSTGITPKQQSELFNFIFNKYNNFILLDGDKSSTNEIQSFDIHALNGTDLELSLSQDATTETIPLASLLSAEDNVFEIKDNLDNTKVGQFQASGITTATTRVYTLPDVSGTIALTTDIPSGHDAVTLAGAYDYLTLSGQQITRGQIDLTTDVTGLLPQTNFVVTGDWAGTFDGQEGAWYVAWANLTGVPAGFADGTDDERSEEEVEDFVGGMLGGTETGISVTYQDASNDIDFVVDFIAYPGTYNVNSGSTSFTMNWSSYDRVAARVDMTSASTVSTINITFSNPVDGGIYTIWFDDVNASGHNLNFPTNVHNLNNTDFDGGTTVEITEGYRITCQYYSSEGVYICQ